MSAASLVLSGFALATVVQLLALIAGTGSIGQEIDDGSIVYLLAEPLARSRIIVTELAVSVAVMLVRELAIGRLVPGARALSVQQRALSLAEAVVGEDASRFGLDAAVSPTVSVVALVLVTVLTTGPPAGASAARITSDD